MFSRSQTYLPFNFLTHRNTLYRSILPWIAPQASQLLSAETMHATQRRRPRSIGDACARDSGSDCWAATRILRVRTNELPITQLRPSASAAASRLADHRSCRASLFYPSRVKGCARRADIKNVRGHRPINRAELLDCVGAAIFPENRPWDRRYFFRFSDPEPPSGVFEKSSRFPGRRCVRQSALRNVL